MQKWLSKLVPHTFKIRERVLDQRLRKIVEIQGQFGFMTRRGTTDVLFVLRQAMEKYREGQSNIEFVFIDILWHISAWPDASGGSLEMCKNLWSLWEVCTTITGHGERVREKSKKQCDGFEDKVGLHQGLVLSLEGAIYYELTNFLSFSSGSAHFG